MKNLRFILFLPLFLFYVRPALSSSPIYNPPEVLQVKQALDVGRDASCFVVDWDGDGDKDLLIGCNLGYVYLFVNIGSDSNPSFRDGVRIKDGIEPLKVSSNASIFVIDFDEDDKGLPDLVIGEGTGKVRLYKNTGEAGLPEFSGGETVPGPDVFDPEAAIGDLDVGTGASVCVTCWNEDGYFDLVVGNEDGNVFVFLNTGTNDTPAYDEEWYVLSLEGGGLVDVGRNASPQICYFDGDDRRDLLIGNADGEVFVLINEGTDHQPKFSRIDQIVGIDVGSNAKPHFCDWDEDGLPDLILGNDEGMVYLYKNNGVSGSPIFLSGLKITYDVDSDLDVGGFSSPWITNWDNDEDLDLLVGNEDGRILLYLNTGTQDEPSFVQGEVISAQDEALDVGYNSAPSVFDFNEDGKKDLLVGSRDGVVVLYRNSEEGEDGNPIFDTPDGERIGIEGVDLDVGYYSVPFVYDWNADGLNDLVIGNKEGSISVFLNDEEGGGTNETPLYSEEGKIVLDLDGPEVQEMAAPVVFDWNEDGKGDLIVGYKNGEVWVYLNITEDDTPVFESGRRVEPVRLSGESGGYARPIVKDWNGDGMPDLIVGAGDGKIYLFEAARLNNPPNILPDDVSYTDEKGKEENGEVIDISQEITITYRLQDGDEDICRIRAEYFDEKEGKWKEASSGSGSDGVEGLSATVDGCEHQFVWASDVDFPDFSGNVRFRLIPDDGYEFGLSREFSIYVDNVPNNSPVVSEISAPPGPLSGDVKLTYRLSDEDGDLCSIEVEYKVLGEDEWREATEGQGGDGKDGLSSSKEGIIHTFSWDSQMDLPGRKESVIFRITPRDVFDEGVGAQSSIFTLENTERIIVIRDSSGNLDVGENSSVFVGDFDNDGKKDLIVGNKDGSIAFYKNKGEDADPRFEVGERIKMGEEEYSVGSASKVSCVDWNEDGKLDLMVGDEFGKVHVLLNQGTKDDPVFTQDTRLGIDVGYNASPFVFDYDGDGIRDLIVGNRDGKIMFYKNTGSNESPGFTADPIALNTYYDEEIDVGDYATPLLYDWNGDGRHDLLSGNLVGEVMIFPNLGQADQTPVFHHPYKLLLSPEPLDVGLRSSPFVVDWDGDRVRDLLLGNDEGYVRLLKTEENKKPVVKDLEYKVLTDGMVKIEYRLEDEDLGDFYFIIPEYTRDGGSSWHPMTLVPNQDGHFNGVLYELSLGPNEFTWDSAKDLDGLDSRVKVRLIPNDGVENGKATVTDEFRVNNNTPPKIVVMEVKGNRDDIEILAVLVDEQSHPSSVSLWIKINDETKDWIEGTFSKVIRSDTGEEMVLSEDKKKAIDLVSTPEGVEYVFTWASLADTEARACKVRLAFEAIDSEDATSGLVEWETELEIDNTPNEAPWIEIIEVQEGDEVHRGNVVVRYRLYDTHSDPCTLNVEYMTWEGEWKSATSASGTLGTTGLASSPEGQLHEFTWASSVDEPNTKGNYKIGLTPSDETLTGEKVETGLFEIDNTGMFSIQIKENELGELSGNGVRIRAPAGVFDEESVVTIETTSSPASLPGVLSIDQFPPLAPEVLRDTLVEVTAEDREGRQIRFPYGDLEITISYRDVISEELENVLGMYYFRDGRWVLLEDSLVDTEVNEVTAKVGHLSYFRLGQVRTTVEGEVDIRPNPFKSDDPNFDLDGGVEIIIPENLSGGRIAIYDVLGQLVAERNLSEESPQNQWRWTLKNGDNNSGDDVASGIYIVVVTKEGQTPKTGKVVVIR